MRPSLPFARIRSLVERALELDAEGRAHLLDRECAGDESLRREVEDLLRAAGDSTEFLERPASPAEGAKVGPWRIGRLLGTGGMGSVHLASRDDGQYEQRAALKLIRAGVGARELLRRFRNERQLLASLEHPGIARLLDGGQTEDGRPYIAMEFVDGVPIDVYCDAKGLDLRARIGLVLRVCDAVAEAHRSLVVHRDLKPSNILVTAAGEPKLIDFGIAKVLGAEPGEATIDLTAANGSRLTPSYASPEQVRGERVTTASDVYSLGVVLYELLTGERPYRIESTEPTAILRIVGESVPPLPSAASPSRARDLRGDLDAIVMKALRKEPDRRYTAVEPLARDLRLHLDGLPVLARPDTIRYRTGKFVRRHALAVGAAGFAVLALAAGLAVSTRLYLRAEDQRVLAERRFEDVRELATGTLFDVDEKIRNLPGSTEARELIASTALDRLDRLARPHGDGQETPALLHDLARAYLRLGDVLGRQGSSSLGRTDDAARAYRKGFELLGRIAPGVGDERDRHVTLAALHARLADVAEAESRAEDAIGELEAALAAREKAAALGEIALSVDPKPAKLHGRLSDLLTALGRLPEADDHLREALRIAERDVGSDAVGKKSQYSLGVQWNKLGESQAAAGDRELSAESHRRALSIFERLSARFPQDANSRRHKAISLGLLAQSLKDLGRREEAVPVVEAALREFEALSAGDGGNARLRDDLAVTWNTLGGLHEELGCPEEALPYFLRALDARREVWELSPRDAWARRALTISLELSSNALRELGRFQEAERLQTESLDLSTSLAEDDPKDARALRRVAYACYGLATLEERRGGGRELAASWKSRTIEVLEAIREQGGLLASDQELLERASEP